MNENDVTARGSADHSLIRQMQFILQSAEGEPLFNESVEISDGQINVMVTRTRNARVEVFNNSLREYSSLDLRTKRQVCDLIELLQGALRLIPGDPPHGPAC